MRVSKTVLSAILYGSSKLSIAPPYANILNATKHLWIGVKPFMLAALFFYTKYLFLVVTSSTMQRNRALRILNLQDYIIVNGIEGHYGKNKFRICRTYLRQNISSSYNGESLK
jgi:hypothetical protein